LTPDYDPWSEYAFPDRSGQLERSARTRATGGGRSRADSDEATPADG
jgi:hypothetical protein